MVTWWPFGDDRPPPGDRDFEVFDLGFESRFDLETRPFDWSERRLFDWLLGRPLGLFLRVFSYSRVDLSLWISKILDSQFIINSQLWLGLFTLRLTLWFRRVNLRSSLKKSRFVTKTLILSITLVMTRAPQNDLIPHGYDSLFIIHIYDLRI